MVIATVLAFGSTIFDKTIVPIYRYAIAPIVRHICYPFKYKSNAENLVKKVEELKETRDALQHLVDEERRSGKSIEKGIEDWLCDVEKITERIEGERVEGEERVKKKCFGIGFCCPNLKNRYQLSSKAAKEALAVADLQENSNFDVISYSNIPQPKFVSGHDLPLQSRTSVVKEITEFVNGHDLPLQSRILVVKEITNALMVADVNTIGVHGMGGVGKTTTVKQVAKQAMEDKLFGEVVMATVTQTPDIRKIQGQLADVLGLKFEEESEWGRAGRLLERLKLKETVLVVLDDLWETIDLEAVGIPSKDEHKGCKILLTSNSKDVLLNGMGCQKDFRVEFLTEEEAWGLFKNMAGDNFGDPEVQSVAIEVAKECARLPVAIVTVARALGNKELSAWQNALQELRRPSIGNFTGELKAMCSCIELSYNHLDCRELKSLFLLCSLLMGYNASIRNLLKYVIGLGLFPNVFSIEEARVRMDALLLKLKVSCLLLENESNEQFAMHDVVRDVAISIADWDRNVFVPNEEVELDLLRKEERQNKATQIWSHCYVAELLEDLKCPQLELLQIFNGDPDPQILRGNIFEGMQKLQVLNLTNFYFSLLPSSLRSLSNLQTLCLDQSVLGDITIIGELKNLEILCFVKCNIKQLPVEISQLTKLKLLDLSDCSELEVIPQNVISKLSWLEELYLGNSFHQWYPNGSNNASISELENLTHLSSLDMHIRDPWVMSKDMFSERLQRYRILIGDVRDWDGMYRASRTLKLKLDASTSTLEHGVHMLLKKTEDLYVLGLNGVKNIICELDREGFPQLKHLHLQNGPEIQYIVDTMEGVQSEPFPVLESLILDDLMSLEKIYHGALEAQSPFRKLKILEVENCHKLKNLFSFSLARCLSQLQNFKVTICLIIEEIVAEEEEEFETKYKATDVIEFTQLCSVSLRRLPHFINFCSKTKAPGLSKTHSNSLATTTGPGEIISEDALRSPTPLFNEKIVFPNLVDLELHSINIETLWHHRAFSIQNLQRLHVESCNGLKHICSAAMVKSLQQLKHLSMSCCEDVEEIIVAEGLREEEMMTELLFPQLEYIELDELPKLRRFCSGYRIHCPLLKRLRIVGCNNLDTFVSNFECANTTVSNQSSEVNLGENCHNSFQPLFNEKVAFPNLAIIDIFDANNVEKIWHNLLAEDSFCKLRSLTIGDCKKLVNIFPPNLLRRFQRLEVLNIWGCSLLKEIFELHELCAGETQSSYAFQLQDLDLFDLSKLKHIWNKDPLGKLNFHNLHTVSVSYCDYLKNVFPFSIAGDLPQLETLMIRYSGVEEIFETEEKGHVGNFVFPRLKTLELVALTKFSNSFSTKHIWSCPTLKSLKVGDCGNVKVFGSKTHGKVQHNSSNQEPLFDVEEVISNLEVLSLDGETTTTSIIWSCQLPTNFRSTVKVLKLVGFRGRSDPVPFGFLQSLQNLETLSIQYSSLKNSFLYERAANNEEENLALLPKMRNLIIDNVDDDVSHLWEQDHWLVPVLQNLRTLKISVCGRLFNLAPSFASFQDLTTLDVHYCHNLLHLITSSIARSLRQLVKLSITYCHMVTEIVARQEDEIEDEIIFNRLEYLELVRLKNLKSFCSRSCTFKFPSLKEMIVESCPKMRFFSPGVVSTTKLPGVCWKRYPENKQFWLGNLDSTIRQMYIEMVGCDIDCVASLSAFPYWKETWHIQPPLKVLSNLASLTVDECPSFFIAIPSNVLQVLSNLKYLMVSKCDSLEEVFDLRGLKAEKGHACLLPNLIDLCLMDLPKLQHIWNRDPRGILDFKSLGSLRIQNCGILRNILTPFISLGLLQLQKIEIINCDMIEDVITEERFDDKTTTVEKIIFPVLRKIVFESLPNLTCIYAGSGTLEFSCLGKIRIHNCPKMKTFIHSLLREQELDSVTEETEQRQGRPTHDIHAAPHFNHKWQVAIPNLRKLGLDWNDTMEEIRHGRFRNDYFLKLEVLKLAHFPEEYAVFPSRFLGRFTNLEKLSVSDASFDVIVQEEETNRGENHDGVLPRLKKLKLSKLPKLVRLSKEDSLPCLAFQNLEILSVSNCGSLEVLAPSAISFQCLRRLEVCKCDGLIKLMTSSTAKFLVKLTWLTVSECELIEEVVANKENEVENEVIFHELKYLTLDRLPSLTSFYLGNCAFMFPSLFKVEVKDCPKIETFSRGFIGTPKFRKVLIEVDDNEWNWAGDLNTAIQKMFTDMGDGGEQSELPSSHQATLCCGSIEAGKEKMHAVSNEGLAPDDLPAMENPNTNIDFLPVVEPPIETQVRGSNGVLKKPESSQLDSRYHGTSEDKDQVVHASSSIDQCVEVPKCPVTKQAPKLASTSSTKASSSQSTTNSTLACETTKEDGNMPTAVFERQASKDSRVTGTSQTSKDLPPVVEKIYRTEEHMFKGALRKPEVNLLAQDFLATSYVKDEPQQDLATPACSIEKSSLVSHLTLVEQVSLSTTASQIKTVPSQELTSGTATEQAPGSSSSMQEQPIVDVESQISLQVQKFSSATEMLAISFLEGLGVYWNDIYHGGDAPWPISTLAYETTQADGNVPTVVCERQAYEDLHANGTSQTSKDLPAAVETILKPYEDRFKGVLREPENALLDQDFHAASPDKDKPRLDLAIAACSIEKSSLVSHSILVEQVSMSTTAAPTQTISSQELTSGAASEPGSGSSSMQEDPTVDVETQISLQVQKFPPATEMGQPLQGNVIPDISLQQSITNPIFSATPVQQVPVSTSASAPSTTSYQDLTFSITSLPPSMIPAIPSIEMSSHSTASFEPICASMELLINTSPATTSLLTSSSESQESSGANFETHINSLALMDIDELLAMLEENQALMSRGVISNVSSPRTSSAEPEVDEKEVHDRIAIVEKVLAGGPETLCFFTSIEVVKESLEFLCINPVDQVSSERMEIVKKLSAELNNITRKVRSFTEAQSDLNTLTETHRTMMVSSKELLDEIMAIKEARTKTDADIGEAKDSLKRLEQQVAELKDAVAAYHENAAKESAKIAAKAREALHVQKQGIAVMEQIQFHHPNYRKTKKELKAVHRAWNAWKASFGFSQPEKNELHGQEKVQTSPTPIASKAHLSPQIQMDTPATDKMDVDDLLAMLEENQVSVSRGVISPVSSPGSSSTEPEVDEKDVHDRIAIVQDVLASGPESLCFHFSIEVVKEALEFLCVNPVDHLVSAERMEVVKKLSAELDDIARKVRSFTEARSNWDALKETHRTMVALSKQMLDEIAVLKEAKAEGGADTGENEESLKRLEQQVAELKKVIADYDENAVKESAKIAAKAREAVEVQKQAKGVMEQIQSRHPNYRKTKKELKAVHRAWDAWKASFGL